MSKQKKWIIGVGAVVIICFLILMMDPPEDDVQEVSEGTETTEQETASEESDEENVIAESETEETAKTSEPNEPENDIPEEIADLHLTDVNNDSTGEWQKAVTSDNVNMPDNALDYFNTYMDDGDTHYIVSFATNTTIAINDLAGDLYVTITEYESGEEHDADKIGGGMLLMDYVIDKSDGAIEEM